VRVVIDSGIDSKTNKVVGKVGVKLCFVNRTKSWREITTQVFTTNTGLVKTIKAQEAAEKFVKTCKHCKAKKFTAKTGNVVCSNACWTAWGGKKKSATPKKKTSQKIAAQKTKAARQKNLQRKPQKKSSQKNLSKKMTQRAAQKSSQKKRQKIVAEILPGDLVSVERVELDTFKEDYTGKVLGIVMSVAADGKVNVNWTANTSNLQSWDLPFTNWYTTDSRHVCRIKVLSRNVEWAEAS
jgi:uncharacterized Zn finger protein (UPF0148 family)